MAANRRRSRRPAETAARAGRRTDAASRSSRRATAPRRSTSCRSTRRARRRRLPTSPAAPTTSCGRLTAARSRSPPRCIPTAATRRATRGATRSAKKIRCARACTSGCSSATGRRGAKASEIISSSFLPMAAARAISCRAPTSTCRRASAKGRIRSPLHPTAARSVTSRSPMPWRRPARTPICSRSTPTAANRSGSPRVRDSTARRRTRRMARASRTARRRAQDTSRTNGD